MCPARENCCFGQINSSLVETPLSEGRWHTLMEINVAFDLKDRTERSAARILNLKIAIVFLT